MTGAGESRSAVRRSGRPARTARCWATSGRASAAPDDRRHCRRGPGVHAQGRPSGAREPVGPAQGGTRRCARARADLAAPGLTEVYRSKVAALHEALADEATRDAAFELTRSLIDKVVVTPADGDVHIDLQGESRRHPDLMSRGRRGGRPDAQTLAQIALVAGAYNHLYRTFMAWTRPYRWA